MQSADLKEWTTLDQIQKNIIVRKIFVFGNIFILLSDNGTISGAGSNLHGLLNCGRSPSIYSFKEISLPTKIRDFSTNGKHALAISEEGYLYSWGSDMHDQLGRKGDNYPPSLVEKVFAVRIKEAVCGNGFSCVVTEEGKVYEWGIKGYNWIILVSQSESTDAMEVSEEDKIVSIQASKHYPVILTDRGKVFIPTIFNNESMSNFHMNGKSLRALGGLLKTRNIIQVLSGKKYAFALTSSGEIFQWMSSPSHAPDPNLVAVKIGRVIKLWTSSTHDVLVAANSLGSLYSITWTDSGILLSVTQLPFSSAGKFFAKLNMLLEGPVYDDRDLNFHPEKEADNVDEWKESFEEAFNKMEDSDISFVIGGETIYAHRAILSIRSSYLNALLKNEWKESSENNKVTIQGYTHPTYLRYMRFLYTGALGLSSHEDNLELLKLANEYVEKSLLKLCKDMVIRGLTAENTISTYNFAIVLGLEDVLQACKNFIGKNLENVVLSEDFSNQDKDDIIRIVREMVCSRVIIGGEKKD